MRRLGVTRAREPPVSFAVFGFRVVEIRGMNPQWSGKLCCANELPSCIFCSYGTESLVRVLKKTRQNSG